MCGLRSLAFLSVACLARALPHETRGEYSLTVLPSLTEFDLLTVTVVYDITNVGLEPLKIVKYETILDDQRPTKSFSVFKDGTEIPFTGIEVSAVHAFHEICSHRMLALAAVGLPEPPGGFGLHHSQAWRDCQSQAQMFVLRLDYHE